MSALDNVPWAQWTQAPDDPAEIISEWMLRHMIDTVADDEGVTMNRSASAVEYAEAALEEIRMRGLAVEATNE